MVRLKSAFEIFIFYEFDSQGKLSFVILPVLLHGTCSSNVAGELVPYSSLFASGFDSQKDQPLVLFLFQNHSSSNSP